MPRKLKISAKCSDLCWMGLTNEDGKTIEGEHNGYVPTWFPNPTTQHYGDYVDLTIDLETGQIDGWKKPTKANLKETFE